MWFVDCPKILLSIVPWCTYALIDFNKELRLLGFVFRKKKKKFPKLFLDNKRKAYKQDVWNDIFSDNENWNWSN